MSLELLAEEIAVSIARHQSRGLVDRTNGMTDVIIHGRVDLVQVAEEVLALCVAELQPVRRSWRGWFVHRAEIQRKAARRFRANQKRIESLDKAGNEAEAALIRLRLRKTGADTRL